MSFDQTGDLLDYYRESAEAADVWLAKRALVPSKGTASSETVLPENNIASYRVPRISKIEKLTRIVPPPSPEPEPEADIAERVAGQWNEFFQKAITAHNFPEMTPPDDYECSVKKVPTPPKMAEIIKTVASFYQVSIPDIKSIRRTGNLLRPRQIIMFLARTLTVRSLPEIGRLVGDRDHTTVLHGIRKMAGVYGIDYDDQLAMAAKGAEIWAELNG